MIIELLVTLKGDRVYKKGEVLASPFPPDIAAEVGFNRGSFKVIHGDERAEGVVVSEAPIETPVATVLETVETKKPTARRRRKLGS